MHLLWSARSEHDLPTGLDWLTPAEHRRAASMRFTKRRLEFLVSRWTAKQAIARVVGAELVDDGAPTRSLARFEIRHHPDGAPAAFVDGLAWERRISMTDRAGWAVCLISPDGAEVGCDLEIVEPRSAAFVADYLTPPEQMLVAGAGDRDEMANLVWSAKESALKVLRTGLRRDTRTVEVAFPPGSDVDGWSPLRVDVDGGVASFPGWWRRFGVFLLTVAAVKEPTPPTFIGHPGPLDTARPIHSWLDRPLA